MNPVLDIIFRDLAHGAAASALPAAPVVPHVPGRAALLSGRLGTALHHAARRVGPQAAHRPEVATCHTA
ncbi:MAG: hypothetical protein ACJ711_08200 [Ornithinibacter sp.]